MASSCKLKGVDHFDRRILRGEYLLEGKIFGDVETEG